MVTLSRALTHSSTPEDVFMFFGADVTHTSCTKEKPSIAAVIGSIDATSDDEKQNTTKRPSSSNFRYALRVETERTVRRSRPSFAGDYQRFVSDGDGLAKTLRTDQRMFAEQDRLLSRW